MSTLDFATVFSALAVPATVIDRELRYVAVNPSYLALMGAAPTDLLGQSMIELFPHDAQDPNNASLAMLRSSIERVLATGQPDELAVIPYRVPRVRGGDPELRHWSATHTPVLDTEGRTAFVVQQTNEILPDAEFHHGVVARASRVQETSAQLHSELAALRSMFEQAPGFMCFVRAPEYRFELANAAYIALIGGDRSLVGKTVREVFVAGAGGAFIDVLDEVYRSGEAQVGRDVRVALGAPPQERILDFVCQPILGSTGQNIGIFVQGHDLTEQRSAEAARALLADEHRVLLELLPQQIWTARPDGQLDSVNEQGERYFGITRERLIGEGWLGVLHPDDVPATVARWTHSLVTGEPYEHEFRLRAADGTYRWHLVRAIARRDASGAIQKWLGTNTDIDDARRTHDELLARVDYEQQLIGIVSHDLRNPLSAIGIAAELLEGSGDPATAKVVSHITSATARAGQLITDLLDFAQARSGTFPVHAAPTNLAVLTRRAVEDARMLSGPRQVEVVHAGPEVGSWDEGRIAQVIANLVGNAFQHAPADAAISVRSRIDGEQARIEVHNGGPPIPDHDRSRLFEPFARGRSARTHRGRSVGLGLFIARQIVLAHKGELTVRSTPAEGTTFTVMLPTRVA